jgi:hypothetical protein
MLRPFFCYYGGKWRAAPKYPTPDHSVIIEPFAGAAGYSLRHATAQVHLYDIDPTIVGLWQWLIKVKVSDVLALPLAVTHVDDLHISQEAKSLIGFWLNKGTAAPCKRPSAWMREGLRPNSFWGEHIRQRIASQVDAIRHWKVFQESYETIPNGRATWFIDPPYQNAVGRHYRCSAVDFPALGRWCEQRRGQVIVCEQAGATWMPFEPFCTIKANEGGNGKGTSEEVFWYSETP